MAPRIIYLHGFASGPQSGKAQFFRERFATQGVDLEIPDLAGGDFENLTITGQLNTIEHLADGDPVLLIGSSMGGYLAALYAARHHEVSRAVLLAPAFEFARRCISTYPVEQVAAWKQVGYTTVFHHADGRNRKLIDDSLNYEDFPDVRQPVLVFHGLRDTVVPPSVSEQFAAFHPNCALKLVDSDHELKSAVEIIWSDMRQFLLDSLGDHHFGSPTPR